MYIKATKTTAAKTNRQVLVTRWITQNRLNAAARMLTIKTAFLWNPYDMAQAIQAAPNEAVILCSVADLTEPSSVAIIRETLITPFCDTSAIMFSHSIRLEEIIVSRIIHSISLSECDVRTTEHPIRKYVGGHSSMPNNSKLLCIAPLTYDIAANVAEKVNRGRIFFTFGFSQYRTSQWQYIY